MSHRSSLIRLVIALLFAGAVFAGVVISAQSASDRCLVPATIRDAILNETSG